MNQPPISNEAKAQLWADYDRRRPSRVPVRLSTNPRIILLDPQLNAEGYTFEQAAVDPEIHVKVSLQWQHYVHTELNRFTDSPFGVPDVWPVHLVPYNVVEAAAFGADVMFPDGQVPTTEPPFDDSRKWELLDADIEHPLESGYLKQLLDFWRDMEKVCADLRFEGRPVRLEPWAATGTDGPLTVGMNLRGSSFMIDMIDDPEYFDRAMDLFIRAAIVRRRAFFDYWGDRLERANGMADDSCAMVGADTYCQRILHHHRAFYDAGPSELRRFMHLCGNATHLFTTMVRHLNVDSFDTGFPVDHGALRRDIGPDIEVSGGPPIDLLLNAAPNEVHCRTRDILLSGIKQGGRFILQEGNNLPPRCPLPNLEAMYQACGDFGGYDEPD